ncbi:MAG: hypothetical protein ACK4GL_02290 [Flavobacteriales bacterium]
MKNAGLFVGLVMMAMFLSIEIDAQCAMCKAVVESNIEGGGKTVGKGLNDGILYLMTIPYFIIGALAYMFYKNWKGNKSANA